MLRDEESAQGSVVGTPPSGARQFVWPVPLPQGAAAKLNECARHQLADSVALAKPMPDAMRDQIGEILVSSAILASGPLISAYQCVADLHAKPGIDNFLGVEDGLRHIGPSKLVVATSGPLKIRTEATGADGTVWNDLELAVGEGALVLSERARYQILTDQTYVIVHAFF